MMFSGSIINIKIEKQLNIELEVSFGRSSTFHLIKFLILKKTDIVLFRNSNIILLSKQCVGIRSSSSYDNRILSNFKVSKFKSGKNSITESLLYFIIWYIFSIISIYLLLMICNRGLNSLNFAGSSKCTSNSTHIEILSINLKVSISFLKIRILQNLYFIHVNLLYIFF